MNHVTDNLPSRKEYMLNLSTKLSDPDFLGDLEALLPPGIVFDFSEAYDLVLESLIKKI
jgi:hypothetical protein